MPPRQHGQAYRLDSGSWGLRYYDVEGRRRRLSPFASKQEALAHYEQVIGPRVRAQPDIADEQVEIRVWQRRNRRRADEAGWVYVVLDTSSGNLKIGRTIDSQRRLTSHQTGADTRLVYVLAVPGGRSLEQRLLALTNRFSIDGAGKEWRRPAALEVVIALIRERATT
jgi:hypothetical protein